MLWPGDWTGPFFHVDDFESRRDRRERFSLIRVEDAQQLNVEYQIPNLPESIRPPGAVAQRCWDPQFALAARLHAFDALVPAFDHVAVSKSEAKRRLAVGAVEFLPIRFERSRIEDLDDVTFFRFRPFTLLRVLIPESGRLAGGILLFLAEVVPTAGQHETQASQHQHSHLRTHTHPLFSRPYLPTTPGGELGANRRTGSGSVVTHEHLATPVR